MKKSDFIAIAGILLFAVTFAVDRLIKPMSATLYIVLVAVSMVLLIVGAIVSRKNHRGGVQQKEGAAMKIRCVWEHNGGDTLLYAVDLPGAYARGDSKEAALEKMRREIPSFLRWAGCSRAGGTQGRGAAARPQGAYPGRP